MPFKNSMEEKMQICHFQNSQKGNKCPIFKLVIDPGSYFQVLELLLKVLFGTNHRGSGSVDQPKMSYEKSSIAMDFTCSQCCWVPNGTSTRLHLFPIAFFTPANVFESQ